MIKYKNILVVSAVLLLSLGTYAITKITGEKHVAADEQKTNAETTDNEVTTNDDPWKEIEKIVAGYYGNEGINYKGTMQLLDESTEKEKVLEQMNFEYSILGSEYYYKMGNFECVNKEDLLMVIDNDSKSISVTRQNQPASQKMIFNPDDFKKILEQKSGIVKVTKEGNEKIITIDSIQDATVQGYRIHYDPSTYRINKLEIGMVRLNSLRESEDTNSQEQNVGSEQSEEIPTYTYLLEINYEKVTLLSLKKESFHPENKFININQNIIQLAPAYSSYSLMDAGE